jgi:MFS family permease
MEPASTVPAPHRVSAFALIARNRDLLRLEAAFAGFSMAEWATWIAVMVFAYQRGGASEAGLVAVVQLVPSAVVAPFASALGDRYQRRRFLMWGYAAQSLAMAATGIAMLEGAPVAVVFALAAAAATSVTLSRPGQGALLPALVSSPAELTAANAAQGAIESFAFFAGPALAGVLLGLWGPHAVFLAMAGVVGLSALLTLRIRNRGAVAGQAEEGLRAMAREALGGFRALASDPPARVVVGLTAGQSLVIGALDVLTVVLALTLLGIGPSGAGYLTSALGAGGIIGSVAAVSSLGGRRLTPAIAVGAVALGLPVAVMGIAPNTFLAVAMLAVAGGGRVVLDVAGRTLLQRIMPDEILARVFGVLEGLYMAALAAGSLAASVLVSVLGPRGALLALGGVLPMVLLAAWPRLMRIDREAPAPPAKHVALLRATPMFAPLAPMALERLAATLSPVAAPAGAFILRQGAPGDRFYVVVEGEVVVEIDGRPVATGSSGFSFGEISLLRTIPRTASVRAQTPVRLLALDREPFLRVVTGNPRSSAAAARIVESRLTEGTR